VFKARCIVEGDARGIVLSTSQPIAFLRGIDPETGVVSDPKHELHGKEISHKILVFPNSVGSSVGAYVIYRLKRNGKAPVAIINEKTDTITASGCAIAGIPLLDTPECPIGELKTDQCLLLKGKKGEIRLQE
jgi:predicted aconitase with swiveling domain